MTAKELSIKVNRMDVFVTRNLKKVKDEIAEIKNKNNKKEKKNEESTIFK